MYISYDSRDSPATASKSKFGASAKGVPPPSVITDISPTLSRASTFTNNSMPRIAVPMHKAPPKNPTPKSMNIQDMLAAAKAHMMARGENVPAKSRVRLEADIPLPPLPAAQDRDPEALKDTRPPPPPMPSDSKVRFYMVISIYNLHLKKPLKFLFGFSFNKPLQI